MTIKPIKGIHRPNVIKLETTAAKIPTRVTKSINGPEKIQEIVAVDKKLDPNFHQAMIEIEDDQKEPGTIIQEIQKGFMMKDRLLRPSLVGVSKKTEKEEEKSEENKENSDN